MFTENNWNSRINKYKETIMFGQVEHKIADKNVVFHFISIGDYSDELKYKIYAEITRIWGGDLSLNVSGIDIVKLKFSDY